jgi:hypothetical protein
MKKIFAVLVVFAMIATVAFADTGWGGGFGYKIGLFGSDTSSDSEIGSYSAVTGADFSAWFGGDGYWGRVRFLADHMGNWWGGDPFAWVAFKPIDLLTIRVGHNPDGDYGFGKITGWGFNASAQDFVAIDNNSEDGGNFWKVARDTGFYGGYAGQGISFVVDPMDMLSIHFVLPFTAAPDEHEGWQYPHWTGWWYTKEVFKRFQLGAVIRLTDIGEIGVAFKGAGGKNEDIGQYNSFGNIYASFFLSAVENLGVDIGFDFGLPYNDDGDTKVQPGLAIGLGVTFGAGDFGVKFRAGAKVAGKYGDAKNATEIGFGILPYYNLGILTAFLNAGVGIAIPDEGDNVTEWFVNPYVQVPVGGVTFWAGFKLCSDGIDAGDGKIVNWSVPIGFSVGF